HLDVSHRDLHSFPTRRSSDLVNRVPDSRRCQDQIGINAGVRDLDLFESWIPSIFVSMLLANADDALDLTQPRSFEPCPAHGVARDRKSTRLNSSHVSISYAVF